MEVAFSGHAVSFTTRFSAIRALPPLLKTLTLPRQLRCKFDHPGFRISPSIISRRPFTAALRVSETGPKTIYGDEDDEINENELDGEVDPESQPKIKTLFQAYKEAILDGDGKMVSEIEAMILNVDDEKNDLVQKVGEMSVEITSGKEKFLRLKADLDNFRKRFEKDRLTLTSDVQGEVIESLLPMVDSFERAKQQIKLETEKEKKIDASYQGIYKQFVEIMRSLNVAVVETVGKPFDPSLHEAIAREESPESKAGIVIQEFRRGFILGSRLLRPAMVKVSAGPGPGPKKASAAPQKSTHEPESAPDLDLEMEPSSNK